MSSSSEILSDSQEDELAGPKQGIIASETSDSRSDDRMEPSGESKCKLLKDERSEGVMSS